MSEQAPTSIRVYLNTFAALMGLLVLTVGVAYIHLGPLNNVAALGIATVKAYLVLAFFMHLRHSSGMLWILATAGFLWLGIMLAFTASDFWTRGWVDS